MNNQFRKLVEKALEEDVGKGDITSLSLFEEDFTVEAELKAKAPGTICGTEIFREVFLALADDLTVQFHVEDGEKVEPGMKTADLRGPVLAMMAGERTALNFLQRLSGIATLTSQFVEKAPQVEIYDTRKTTPLLRELEKYAVRTGGGHSHRSGLYDMVLIKENHIFAYMSRHGIEKREDAIREAVAKSKSRVEKSIRVEVEVENCREAVSAFLAGADIIMFDNSSPDELNHFVCFLGNRRNRVSIEWSGNVDIETAISAGRLPVDRVSVGELTHSARALDFSLKLK